MLEMAQCGCAILRRVVSTVECRATGLVVLVIGGFQRLLCREEIARRTTI